ncbi:MAG: hypothetical protein PHW76_06015 [Alphaproteobacteria bacterium]|nr:hypothetical protein [Alphaproteobacteria bacterium]
MANSMKKHEFLLPFPRLYTRGMADAFDSTPFQWSESYGDETFPALTSPTTWSAESVSVMAEAAHSGVPADLRANEENTVPSWLWRHQSRSSRREAETDIRDIVNRAVGSAAAKAWKLGLFTSEKHARAFYDEARFAFIQRHFAVLPEVLSTWGLSWAYGVDETPKRSFAEPVSQPQLSNADIDVLLEKAKEPKSVALWRKLFARQGNEIFSVPLRLRDIAADWHSTAPNPARAVIDLLALRNDDGGICIDALRHTTRLLVILLDLHERRDVTIGLVNLAPLLMAAGLVYDSDAGRAMAASLAALVAAESAATSAELASLRGMSPEFMHDRDIVMRALRNHRRAVYGDGNDYEKLSVLPAPLPLKNCPDLALVAEAQRRWDDAVEAARAYGLRATQATDLTPSARLSVLMSSASQGLEPMPRLTSQNIDETGRTSLHPALTEAFIRMGYPSNIVSATTEHIAGTFSILKAPKINVNTLKARGLDRSDIEKIEAYLPHVNSVRLAITPWVIGIDVCATKLGISEEELKSPSFNLLDRLGFTGEEVEEANLYCFGHGTARNAKPLPLGHRPLFACGDEVGPEARIRMAAAVQSFISGDTGLAVRLPASQSVTCGAETTLSAWRVGLKSLTLVFDPQIAEKVVSLTSARRIKASGKPAPKPVVAGCTSAKHTPVLVAKKATGARRVARCK